MSDSALSYIEAGMSFAEKRAAFLAADIANARTPDFRPMDLTLEAGSSGGSARLRAVPTQVEVRGTVGAIEYAMTAQAKNSMTYRALADQERAMLHELRTVAEESRR
ncbi:MAG: hypothetical protein ACR2KS_06560 [Candidatus Eremiobacter antarcticus]|nr:hypothetical protein [Candidatus Eremiobacteraeota bacterium]MBC5807954.1 hypothetical protein [Candidatus Eremiobacteraeota bacterium]